MLIVACPCALGLATPTALLVGSGRGAQLGIVIRGPEILESTRRVDTIVLDKTGTVTQGRMTLADVVAGGRRRRAPRRCGSPARSSTRPSTRSRARSPTRPRRAGALAPVEGFRSRDGLGVEGVVDGRAVVVGRPGLLEEWGIALPPELQLALASAQERGRTAVVGGVGRPRARRCSSVADAPKPTSAEAVAELKRLGLRPVLLTGDNEPTARAVAAEVGIDEVIAEVLPAEKAAVVERLQREGRVVAMVGDGVNDAPALARADLGLAIGTGTDVAIEASDLTLVGGDLRGAVDAIRLSTADARDDQGQPVLGVRLQRRGAPARRRRLPEPADRRRRDGVLQRVRRLELAAAAPFPADASPGGLVRARPGGRPAVPAGSTSDRPRRQLGLVEPVEPLDVLTRNRAAVERHAGAVIVQHELPERVVEARPAHEPPVGPRAWHAGGAGEEAEEDLARARADETDGAPLHRGERVPEGRAHDLEDAARTLGGRRERHLVLT